MSKKEYSAETMLVAMALVDPIGNTLGEKGLISTPKREQDSVKKLELVREGANVIREICDKAFKKNEEAQKVKTEVQEFLIDKHYEFFGFSYEAEVAGE